MGIFEKFKIGLNKSASSFSDGIKNLVIKKKIDEETLNKIEEFLIMSDVGVDVAGEIRKIISEKKILPNQDSIMQVNQILLNYIEKLMNPLEKEILNNENVGTKVFLIAGVNGVGKTTTIGKLGKILKKNNKKIIFAATDTFRAAAIEQLENWSKKIDVKIIKSETGSDPASVAFKALEFAIKNNFDYVLIDTAGRLQNKKNLMEEYKKISNVTKKIDPNSPHEVLLVLDATTGQNALIQVEEFQKIAPITGIIMTKLDGTAKGGILIALAKKFNLPIIALGLGEKEDDLQIFNSKDFAKALININ
jgi:fused signal recognition particle receptor